MFSERELKLLAILLSSEEWISGKILSNMLNIRSRTLQSEISMINSLLSGSSSSNRIASNNRLGYRFEGNRDQIKKFVAETGSDSIVDSFQSANSILTVLLYENDYITLNQIAEKTFLANSSVSANLDKVRKMIDRTKSSVLSVHPRKGYRLEAEEHVKRMLIVNALDDVANEVSKQYPQIMEGYELLDEIRRILENVFLSEDYIVEGKAFDAFSRCCAFSIARQLNGYDLSEDIRDHDINPIIMKIADEIQVELNYSLNRKELLCIDDRLEELNVLGTTKKDYPLIEEKIKSFLDQVRKETGLSLNIEVRQIKRLSEHLFRMNRRIDVGNYLRVEDPEIIEKQYPVALHLIRTVLKDVFESDIPGNEERTAVPYIASFIDELPEKVDINIISDYPIGEIYHFRSKLYKEYGSYINRVYIFPTYLYEERYAGAESEAVMLTTEEKLVFQYKQLTYINLYDDTYQPDAINKTIRTASAELKKKGFLSYKKEFSGSGTLCIGITDIGDFIEEQLPDSVSEKLSYSLINETTILIIDHTGKDHLQKTFEFSEPFVYKKKMIGKILYFNIGQKEDTNLFCQYIREYINNRT